MLIQSSEATYHQTIDNFHTGRHLDNARKQAEARKLDDVLIIDVDCHHYETDNLLPIIQRIEDPSLRQNALNMYQYKGASAVLYDQPGYQDVGGRVSRYIGRKQEKIENATGAERDVKQAYRWMDAMSVDYACLFPTPMLFLGLHPQVEVEVNMAKAYNSWMVEEVLAGNPRLRSMLYLPFNDPQATYDMVKKYAGTKGVIGFMVVSTRYRPVYHNDYMKTYALLEEMRMPISFHASYSWSDPLTSMTNRFITAHAVGFTFFNAVHCANWVINGLPERFPKLKVIWIESGLAWIPWLMQRLDHDFRMRTSECPSLKRLPSEYMAGDVLHEPADGDGQQPRGDRVDVQDDQRRVAAAVLVRLPALGHGPAARDLGPAVPLGPRPTPDPRRQREAAVQHRHVRSLSGETDAGSGSHGLNQGAQST